jgi:hypothetical protein
MMRIYRSIGYKQGWLQRWMAISGKIRMLNFIHLFIMVQYFLLKDQNYMSFILGKNGTLYGAPKAIMKHVFCN